MSFIEISIIEDVAVAAGKSWVLICSNSIERERRLRQLEGVEGEIANIEDYSATMGINAELRRARVVIEVICVVRDLNGG